MKDAVAQRGGSEEEFALERLGVRCGIHSGSNCSERRAEGKGRKRILNDHEFHSRKLVIFLWYSGLLEVADLRRFLPP